MQQTADLGAAGNRKIDNHKSGFVEYCWTQVYAVLEVGRTTATTFIDHASVSLLSMITTPLYVCCQECRRNCCVGDETEKAESGPCIVLPEVLSIRSMTSPVRT